MADSLVGQTFNSLFVERFIRKDKKRGDIYEARCLNIVDGKECGNKRPVGSYSLKKGEVKMCRDCAKQAIARAHTNWYVEKFYAQREPPR